MRRDKFRKLKKNHSKTNDSFLKQKVVWFGEAFLFSWIAIFFMVGFIWVSSGSGHSVMSLDQSALNAITSSDTRVNTNTIINVMGFNISVPTEQYKEKLKLINQYKVLIPPAYRVILDLLGMSIYTNQL